MGERIITNRTTKQRLKLPFILMSSCVKKAHIRLCEEIHASVYVLF